MTVLQNGHHELFAQKWHETENKTEAFRYVYKPQCKRWKDDTIYNKASAMSKKSDIVARYEELKQETADTHGITIATLLDELDSIKVIAMGAETPQCSAAVSSVMSKAKLVGLDVLKIELTANEELTPWRRILAEHDD